MAAASGHRRVGKAGPQPGAQKTSTLSARRPEVQDHGSAALVPPRGSEGRPVPWCRPGVRCRQSSARRPSLPHVTWWAVCPDSPLKGTPFAGLGPTRVQEDLLSVLSFITPAQVQLHHQTIV